jgi:hypothetical protein
LVVSGLSSVAFSTTAQPAPAENQACASMLSQGAAAAMRRAAHQWHKCRRSRSAEWGSWSAQRMQHKAQSTAARVQHCSDCGKPLRTHHHQPAHHAHGAQAGVHYAAAGGWLWWRLEHSAPGGGGAFCCGRFYFKSDLASNFCSAPGCIPLHAADK